MSSLIQTNNFTPQVAPRLSLQFLDYGVDRIHVEETLKYLGSPSAVILVIDMPVLHSDVVAVGFVLWLG